MYRPNFSGFFSAGVSNMMARAMTALVAKHIKKQELNHRRGPGRRTLYTYHVKLNGGSHPVPGGGTRERERHLARSMRAESRRGAA